MTSWPQFDSLDMLGDVPDKCCVLYRFDFKKKVGDSTCRPTNMSAMFLTKSRCSWRKGLPVMTSDLHGLILCRESTSWQIPRKEVKLDGQAQKADFRNDGTKYMHACGLSPWMTHPAYMYRTSFTEVVECGQILPKMWMNLSRFWFPTSHVGSLFSHAKNGSNSREMEQKQVVKHAEK